ncbi:ABC transporter permease [Actinophytocola sediminis]
MAWVVVLLVLGWAFVPQLFTGQDPIIGQTADRLQGPSTGHWFGTDELGRDIYTRVVHGASLTLRATLVAVLVGLAGGVVLGLTAGFGPRRLDDAIMRFVDVLLAIPGLLLSLAIVTALGFGTVNVAIAVGVGSIASFARVMRAETLRVRTQSYVEAGRASGATWWTVLHRHVLRNAYGPVLALTALEFGSAVLSISALSFLGFGAQPPAPEWGALVSQGRDFMAVAWWMTTLPGLVVAVIVVSFNRISTSIGGDDD